MPRIIQIENKFGLVDENGKSVLPLKYDTIYSSIPNYENEASTLTSLSPVYIFKKDDKYSYAYYVSLDTLSSFKLLPKNERYWKIGNLIYDSISEGFFGLDHYTDTTNGFNRRPYYVFKFKLNDKWGMFYIRGGGTYIRTEFATPVSLPGRLGQLEVVMPIYDKIITIPILRRLYTVRLNGRWTFLQVLHAPKGHGMNDIYDDNNRFKETKIIPLTWIEKTFYNSFDTIPKFLGGWRNESGYFKVKKDNKWGTVKLDENGILDYIIPCIYDSIGSHYAPMIAYTDSSTVLYDYNRNGKNIEIKLIKGKDYLSYFHSYSLRNFHLFEFTSNYKLS